MEVANLKIVLILTMGFTLASILGYITQRLKLSPILGYLLAGYAIGPFSPGFVADLKLSEQLAEVGVILMMFGVGLHFKWEELVGVRRIAIPGALGQTLIATLFSIFLAHYAWGAWQVGLILGLAIGVASTVVLVRVLSDNNLLKTPQGHIAVGWLIVEDVLTVAVLILLPTIVSLMTGGELSLMDITTTIFLIIFKFLLLIAIMFTIGKKIVSYSLYKIAQTRSSELFTLAVLALTFFIATCSALIFGTSIALGAFVAGMVIGQTEVRHQASAYASPLKNAFVVIFFLSVGMLFNPYAIAQDFSLFLGVLFIVLVVKPLAAFIIMFLMRYPTSMAVCVAISLGQIGEFSFILGEEASNIGILPDDIFDIIVACALISITINPIIFKAINGGKRWFRKNEAIIQSLTSKADSITKPKALIIGYGAIEENMIPALEIRGFQPVIIDKNVDMISKLVAQQRDAIYGEASYPYLLEAAQIIPVKLILITLLDMGDTLNIIHHARNFYPEAFIIARAETREDKKILEALGAAVVCEEEEITSALCQHLNQLNRSLA